MPPLTDSQKKHYNSYRAEGMTPEQALSLATKGADNQFNPAIEAGSDNILFGQKSLGSSVVQGLKEATFETGRDIAGNIQKYGKATAFARSPLSILAGAGRGVGTVFAGAAETIDDLTGETVSSVAMPIVEDAVNSDVGQYILEKASEIDQRSEGIAGDIFDATGLLGLPALAKATSAQALKQTVLNTAKATFERGSSTVKGTSRLTDYFKKTANPSVVAIDDNISGIRNVVAETVDDTVADSIVEEAKSILRSGNTENFGERILANLDDVLLDDFNPDKRAQIEQFIKGIEDVLNQDDSTKVIESYLSGGLTRVGDMADSATGVVQGLSDSLIDKGVKTLEKVRQVPEAVATRVKQSNDRRIVRIAKTSPDQAKANILDLYKKAIVPGVKKKAKTVANIEQIDESVQRAIPRLSKKYDVNDLEDFAAAISVEKKAIFAEIEKGLADAGGKGVQIDLNPIVAKLDELLNSERAQFNTPLRNAIARARAEFVTEDGVAKRVSPAGAQELIADLNVQLGPAYRSSNRTVGDNIVDEAIVTDLRKLVDSVVEDLGAGKFSELKSRYADLKRMEDDVVHRTIFEKQKGRGLSDLSDAIAAGDVAAGLALDPAFLAKGAAQYLTKEVISSLNDKNELVRQMFLYGKTLKDDIAKESNAIEYGSGFKISESSEVMSKIDPDVLEAKVDYSKNFGLTENDTIDFYGTELPIGEFELGVLKANNIIFENGFSTTKSGRKASNQPIAAFVRYPDGRKSIRFTPNKSLSLDRALQTFYHEMGHAIDYTGGKNGAYLRHTGWKLSLDERKALVRERLERSLKPTVEKYNLNSEQIDSFYRGERVNLGEGRYLPAPKAFVRYLRGEEEIFAEAYAMYQLNPEKLMSLAPETYQFIDNIVNS